MMVRVVTLLLFTLSCQVGPPAPAPIPPTDTDFCAPMCEHLSKLGCEEGQPVYNSDLGGPVGVPNQSCTAFCEQVQEFGYFVNPRCVSQVTSCSDIADYQLRDPSTCEGVKLP